ncbi:MAG: protein phosphatase 2C domain-containing protein [Deltaproteobacteria bacterium]|jgi:protein phosphatase|nr:protein phosphatase 2C domain-containing protein [Deltaproteobacteria bacterium]
MIGTDLITIRFQAAADVDIGAKRSNNEDEVVFCPEYGFFAVSDGMGGLEAGGETSAMIAKLLPKLIRENVEALETVPSPLLAAKILGEQIELISKKITENIDEARVESFGATLCCLWLIDRHAVFANLGDSRAYVFDRANNYLRQVTNDHNLAGMMVKYGMLSRKEVSRHPASSSLTKYVGMREQSAPDVFIEKLDLQSGILLCSDGLHGMLSDSTLTKCLSSQKDPTHVVRKLIDKANIAGGRDNISVVYVKITSPYE